MFTRASDTLVTAIEMGTSRKVKHGKDDEKTVPAHCLRIDRTGLRCVPGIPVLVDDCFSVQAKFRLSVSPGQVDLAPDN